MVLLSDLGFDAHFEALWRQEQRPGRLPGRVIQEHKGSYEVLTAPDAKTETRAVMAVLAGRLVHLSERREELPAVGDFVVIEGEGDGQVRLAALLPRRTRMVRKAAGETGEQVIAANVDTVFIVTSLNQELNPRRIERYLAAIWDGGAMPVVLLSKADLTLDREELLASLAPAVLGVPLHCISIPTGEGLDLVRSYLGPGKSVALVGSSGVGKSSLANALLGNGGVQSVNAVRSGDDKGRHTTTSRTLLLVPGGGMILDTPGMREFMPSDDGQGVAAVFDDVEELALRCRFTDCRHDQEPGCQVQAAIAASTLDATRLASYLKLQKEQAWLHRRQDARAASTERKKWKKIAMDLRRHPKKLR